jgi:hypothetical protein
MPVLRREGRSVLFVHVPKAGGSAIERVFGQSGWKVLYRDPKEGPDSMNRLRRCSPQHMHRSMLETIFEMDRFDGIFMTVRDPLARFRSEYAMRNQSAVTAAAEHVDEWAERAFLRYAEDPFVFDNHLRPQSEFYVPGCLVYRLEDGLEGVVRDLDARWDLGLVQEVPRVMDRQVASGSASSEVRVSATLEARLRACYSEDLSRFGY